jgi:hypothetical protein
LYRLLYSIQDVQQIAPEERMGIAYYYILAFGLITRSLTSILPPTASLPQLTSSEAFPPLMTSRYRFCMQALHAVIGEGRSDRE